MEVAVIWQTLKNDLLVLIGLNFTICAVLVRNGMKSIQVIVRSDPDLDPLRM
jgi:hypothetical protein